MSKELLPAISLYVAILPWRLRSLVAQRRAVSCQLALGPQNNTGTAPRASRDEAYGYEHALQSVVREGAVHCPALEFTQRLHQSTWGKSKFGFRQVSYHLLSRHRLSVESESVKYPRFGH